MQGIKANERGQVLIIILLIMIVGLTSGILLLGRTTSDISLSTNIEESTRAFNAAEAGIEQAIRSSLIGSSPVPVASGLTYQVNVSSLGGNASGTIYPTTKSAITKTGDIFTLWLVPHNDTTGAIVENEAQAYKNSNLVICFASGSAIGITAYYKSGTNYFTSFVGFDTDSARSGQNGFESAGVHNDCNSNAYTHAVQLDLTSHFDIDLTASGIIPLVFRIQPYYADAYVAVIPQNGLTLPKQGNKIASVGKSGEATRKIEVDERYTVPAPFLDYVLFSYGGSDVTK